jgi:hypothetical protein
LYPEIVDADAGGDPLPSCSAVEALERQEPLINQALAMSTPVVSARLLRYGKIAQHGIRLVFAPALESRVPDIAGRSWPNS